MDHGNKAICILCKRTDETTITGALSTKDEVTAHQNCLLFSAGIFCRNSPQFDDLFGFSVEDVLKEVKRGRKLMCSKCKKNGATAGCEVRRCKKSYHYPCAIQEGAWAVEDEDKGNFCLYCFNHAQQYEEKESRANGCASSSAKSKTPSEARASTAGDSTAARMTARRSDSVSSSTGSGSHSLVKKRLSFTNTQQEQPPAKRKSEQWKRLNVDSSDEDENQPDTDIAIFAPIESDLEGESQATRDGTVSPTVSTSVKDGNRAEDKDEAESDTESESLLRSVEGNMETLIPSTSSTPPAQTTSATPPPWVVIKDVRFIMEGSEDSSLEQIPAYDPAAEPTVSQQSSARTPPSPDLSKSCRVVSSHPCTSSATSPSPPTAVPLAVALPSHPESRIKPSSFWKSCNAAGCTQAIFTDFMNEMKDISTRIQSDQASQEDYDLALKVMETSGKLAEFVAKQQQELQRKQMELDEAAASLQKVVSALRR